VWSETESKGITIPYPNISLHASQAAGARNPDAPGCIYMQLEGASNLTHEPGINGHAHGSHDDDEDDTSELVEIHLTPPDESTCTFHEFYLL
jgi:Regulator of volume decrease after cellular swelling